MTKNKGGRPSKAKNFLVAMGDVLNEDINSIILTDEELFLLANEKLNSKDKICYATFKNYKSNSSKLTAETKALYDEFLALYKKAILKQKKGLFTSLKKDEKAWQRYAWIIERKFDAWNLRKVSEVKQNTIISVSKEDEALLEELE